MSEIILDIQNVSKQYANHTALQDVSFQIKKGSVLGLLGPNGAGKTSLIRIITQITRADTGAVFFQQEPLREQHIYRIGYLPEERGLYRKMQVGEQLLYFAQLKGFDTKTATVKIKDWLERFEMQTWWNKKVEDLSKGMQQKVQFVATVLHQPELLILDEPFSGFDPINAELLKNEILRLNQTGTTVIFSTHRMESVETMCSDVVLINQSKKVLEGETSAIREKYKSHMYQVSGYGSFPTMPDFYHIISHEEKAAAYFECKIRLTENTTPNQVLQQLLPCVEIRSFVEILPTMSEIFIKVVQTSQKEKA
jgi:ABC-2 type transport system ATP-binding protein